MALITAERLHRWKCVFCGSKDKNIVNIKAPISRDVEKVAYQDSIKIVSCNQCGHTDIFSHSAMMYASCVMNTNKGICTIEESEEFVKKFHNMNHKDPKVNPHN